MKFLDAFRVNQEKDELIRKLQRKCEVQAQWIDARMRKGETTQEESLKKNLAIWMRKAENLRQEMPEVFAKYFGKKKGQAQSECNCPANGNPDRSHAPNCPAKGESA